MHESKEIGDIIILGATVASARPFEGALKYERRNKGKTEYIYSSIEPSADGSLQISFLQIFRIIGIVTAFPLILTAIALLFVVAAHPSKESVAFLIVVLFFLFADIYYFHSINKYLKNYEGYFISNDMGGNVNDEYLEYSNNNE